MKVFDINWDKLVLLLLPTFLRKPVMMAFLRSALFPAQEVYGNFKNNREKALFLLKYDTSRRNLELALRMQFDEEFFDEERIYIKNAVYDEGLYLNFYLEENIRPNGFYSERKIACISDEDKDRLFLSFYLDEEVPTADFTIHVPEAIYIKNDKDKSGEIADFANLFTLPGFKFNIVRY